MKRIILILTASVLLAQIIFSQESKTNTIPTEKKYAISVGGSYSIISDSKDFGGNLKLDYLITHKMGLGIKTTAISYRYSNYNTGTYSVIYKPGLYLISDLTITYYIIGDYSESKAGMYADLGLGYQTEKVNTTNQFTDYQPFTVNQTARGFGGHVSLGGSYKLGGGKIYLELMAGTIMYGTFKKNSVFPVGYTGGDTGANYKNTDSFIGDSFLSLNLGYSFSF